MNSFFTIFARKTTIQRLSEISFNSEVGLAESRISGMSVLEKLVQKINDKKGTGRNNNDEDEDDLIIK